ncbi:MAG: hypothetical protein ACO3O1_11175 [Ilumatobacteraceae bacterium]
MDLKATQKMVDRLLVDLNATVLSGESATASAVNDLFELRRVVMAQSHLDAAAYSINAAKIFALSITRSPREEEEHNAN